MNKEKRSNRKRSNGKDNKDIRRDMSESQSKNVLDSSKVYFTDPILAEQATRLSFQSFNGEGATLGGREIPSIMTIALNPSAGVGVYPARAMSSINLAARKLYARLSNKSGRTTMYGPQDVAMAILAIGEIVSLISYIKRFFGVAQLFVTRNRDFPSHIITAMGINYDDFIANRANYRLKLNSLITAANKINVPANISWFVRCDSLYRNVYMDDSHDMASAYAFVPYSTWILNESNSDLGTCLQTVDLYYNSTTGVDPLGDSRNMGTYLEVLRSLIRELLESSTLNLVWADVLNMASNQNVPLLRFEYIDEDYSIVPVYDENVLNSIHNMVSFGPPDNPNTRLRTEGSSDMWTSYNNVYTDANTNSVVYMPLFPLHDTTMGMKKAANFIDFPISDPDINMRIDSTRFMMYNNTVMSLTLENVEYASKSCMGDHYPCGFYMFTNGVLTDRYNTSTYVSDTTELGVTMLQERVHDLSKFKFCPYVYLYNPSHSPLGVVGDVRYYTPMPYNWLYNINELIFLSLFEMRE